MYSPKIKETQVKALYLLREEYKQAGIRKPMTTMVAEAIEEFIEKKADALKSLRAPVQIGADGFKQRSTSAGEKS